MVAGTAGESTSLSSFSRVVQNGFITVCEWRVYAYTSSSRCGATSSPCDPAWPGPDGGVGWGTRGPLLRGGSCRAAAPPCARPPPPPGPTGAPAAGGGAAAEAGTGQEAIREERRAAEEAADRARREKKERQRNRDREHELATNICRHDPDPCGATHGPPGLENIFCAVEVRTATQGPRQGEELARAHPERQRRGE